MKTNKQIKRVIASVTGGKWIVTEQLPHPTLMISSLESSDDYRAFIAFHRVVSIKASEVRWHERSQRGGMGLDSAVS